MNPYGSPYNEEVLIPQSIEPAALHKQTGSFLKNLQADDIILIAIILLLLSDSESDKITVGILIFILLSGFDLF